jgi:hypothetical protein
MLELLVVFRLVLELLVTLSRPIRAVLIRPLVTVTMLLALYVGWHAVNEGDIGLGLHAAFLDSKTSRADRAREVETAVMRAEMLRTAVTDRLIEQLLTALLQRAETAARVRLGVIHNGVAGITGAGLLRVDITNGVAGPGRSLGPLSTNEPLSEWNDALPAMLTGNCHVGATGDATTPARRARLQSMGGGLSLVCPVIDVQGRMLGVVLMSWDHGDPPPSGEKLPPLTAFAGEICLQIAALLDLGYRLPTRIPGSGE